MLSSRHNEKKTQDANKNFNLFSREEAIWSILDFTVLSLNGMLAASSRVSEFPNYSTAAMRHSFTNFPSQNDLEFFAIRLEMAYDVRAFTEGVALSI